MVMSCREKSCKASLVASDVWVGKMTNISVGMAPPSVVSHFHPLLFYFLILTICSAIPPPTHLLPFQGQFGHHHLVTDPQLKNGY